MKLVWRYAFVAGLIGFIPLSLILLLLLEAGMVYHLSLFNKRSFHLGELITILGTLLTLGTLLQAFVGMIFNLGGPLGWIAKGGFAFLFVLCFGSLVNKYYEAESSKSS
jgi:hypothetical protein